jgi:hypothetical protein
MELHPTGNEFAMYQQLGEPAYVDWCGGEAMQFIQGHPADFVRLVLRRILIFWTGADDNKYAGSLRTGLNLSTAKRLVMGGWTLLALLGLVAGFRTRRHMLLLLAVAVYPLPYYITHTTNRYRLPLEPVLTLLAAHALVWMWQHWRFFAAGPK